MGCWRKGGGRGGGGGGGPHFSQQKKISPSREGSGRCWGSAGRRREESVSPSQERIPPLRGFHLLICCNVYSPGRAGEQRHPASHWSNTAAQSSEQSLRSIQQLTDAASLSSVMRCVFALSSCHSHPDLSTNVFFLLCVLYETYFVCIPHCECIVFNVLLFCEYRETHRNLFILIYSSPSELSAKPDAFQRQLKGFKGFLRFKPSL